ncbi:acyltransferase-domain-containing protein [Neurospora tetraspora]|uniref:1-acyl-sn-glycerol-3-phosphate acyltransferase n=1 Tax=Neurospora tetraspora TaxID=94610 RepID=A0AAE0MPU9_9PEZI|nr:acyltransferase-domain-containing protein [Neurospora tetraspora]
MASLLYYPVYFLEGCVVLTIGFYMLSLVLPKAAFVARSLASYLSLLLCAGFGVFTSIAFSLLGHGQSAQWAVGRSFKYVMALTTGVRFKIEDPKNILGKTRPAVFIGNHQTELDVLMLGCMFPKYCSVTAKSSLRKTPFLGWFMSLSGSIFIDRASKTDARAAMAGAANQIQKKQQSVYMFPEGTRSYSKEPELLPFKKGAFHLAVQAQVPIVPVVVANYSHILNVKDLVFNAGVVPIKVLDPIDTTGLTTADVDELCKNTRDLMLKELIALTAKARGQSVSEVTGANNHPSVAKTSGTDMKVAA